MTPDRWQRIETVYRSALSQPEGNRDTFLLEACGSDQELKREVEALLRNPSIALSRAQESGGFDASLPPTGSLRPSDGLGAEALGLEGPGPEGLGPGAQIGVYRIEAAIGAGGMGVVYRGFDTKLNRPVAVKLLSNRAADREARTRFQREARMASSLNHPHIVTVYDAGEFGGRQYLVTEFVDGGTLADWAKQPRPWRQTVELLIGVGDALAAAHAASILHRDIKPGNILLSKSGYAKLADFGLAKVTQTAPSPADVTVTAGTIPGLVLGTPAYMSPEQALGSAMDSRSDIFSFGSMLYELLAGARPFSGKNHLDLLGAIVHKPAPPLPDTIPLALRIIVEKTLEKDPEDRYQTAREMVVDLRRMVRSSSATLAESTPSGTAEAKAALLKPKTARRAHRSSALLGAGVLAAGAAGVLGAYFLWHQPAPAVWQGIRLGGTEIAMNPRISPDGHTLAYVANVGGIGGPEQIAVMKPETGNQAVLTRNPGEISWLSWSPDGTRIYFDRRSGGIYSVPALGGEEQLLSENASTPEALADGTLLMFRPTAEKQPQLTRFWPDSGRVQPYRVLGGTPMSVRAFPGGHEAVVYGESMDAGGTPPHLYILNVDSGAVRRLDTGLPDDSSLSPTLAVTADGASVIAETFAGDGVRFFSIPVSGRGPIQNLFTTTSQAWFLDAAPDGGLYVDQIDRQIHILRFPPEGGHAEVVAAIATSGVGGFFGDPHTFAILPDGRVVAPESLGGHERLALIEAGKDPVPLVNTAEDTGTPVAAAGPGEVVFMLGSQRHRTLARATVANGRIVARIPFDKGPVRGLAATPDGKTIFCASDNAIWAVPADGGEPKNIHSGRTVSISPDGKALLVGDVGAAGIQLVRVPLDGGPEQTINPSGTLQPLMQANPSAFGPRQPGSGVSRTDGRILLPLGTSTWYQPPGLLDPATGRVTPIKTDYITDIHSMGWAPDGTVLALGFDLRSTMWKFQQLTNTAH